MSWSWQMNIWKQVVKEIEDMMQEAMLKIKSDYRDTIRCLESRHEDFWNAVYKELGLDPAKEYSFNSKSGTVSMKAEKVKQSNGGFTH